MDREDAAHRLSAFLKEKGHPRSPNSVLLALPRGGVPIAHELAQSLDIPYDVLIVRKIGHPENAEYGIGALTEENILWINPEIPPDFRPSQKLVQRIIDDEKAELQRRLQLYRNGKSLKDLKGMTVYLVDDGLATGVTARVAAKYIRDKGAKEIYLVVPAGSTRASKQMRQEITDVLSLIETDDFAFVGQFYESFNQVPDEEVMKLLRSRPKRFS
ncbi:phosphoribosyltransferase [Bdellovibrio bacteriovorus]|uniref:phosphoribosyltransferase n=1 Tax=Bdellovibrio bacteriovorus TaxID=959 RepID=UPI0020A2A837|nr:phosphoribosyltransferase family protein [Bdellovibrio bacteriovorus]